MPDNQGFIPPHGNYPGLLSYQKAEIVFDITHRFCGRFLSKGDRTIDQMIQAARSGKQNIAEGSKGVRDLQGNRDQADECGPGES